MVNQLQIESISKQYGMSPPILSNFSLTCFGGTITGLIGKNGTGKSTLLKQLAVLSKPDSGKIIYNNSSIWDKPELYLPHLGVVSDWLELPETLSFDELITWQLERKNYSAEAIKTELNALKTEFDFDERSASIIRTYSSGMKKKTAICAALCGNPSVLIFDEPYQALDDDSRKTLTARLLKEKALGKIILLASHLDHSTAELFTSTIRFPLKN